MAIYIGYTEAEKRSIIAEYQKAHDISKTVVIAPNRFPLVIPFADQIGYTDVIMYVTFYRLLQEINQGTLIVLNECLRTQNRYDLAYNCIRNYLNQTGHVLVFQTLPQIDTQEDFMILFDFSTGSRWKRMKFDPALILDKAEVHVRPLPLDFRRIDVPTREETKRRYEEEKFQRFSALGAKDPHTLPRNLYLVGEKDKLAYITAKQPAIRAAQPSLFASDEPVYVGRKSHAGRSNILTYDDVQPGGAYTIIELPHRFIDYCDFVSYTGQAESDVLVADLKVDAWYFSRYQAWRNRVHDTYASLRG